MFDRFSRSFELVKYSAGVLKKDKSLIVFPLLSSVAALFVLASFIPLFNIDGGGFVASGPEGTAAGASGTVSGNVDYAVMFALYVVEYFVIFFFNAALVGAALIRMGGGDPTVADGLRIAWSRVGRIFGYACIAATVGVLLRAVAERVGLIGRLVIGLLGAGWTVATYLTVPILVSRDVGPVDALQQSVALLKRTWGENLIANAGIGLFFYLVYFVLFAVIVFCATVLTPAGSGAIAFFWIAVGGVALLLTGLVQAALQGIFSAALYHYATDGDAGPGTDAPARAVLAKVFNPDGPPKTLAP